jgi:hypothetical protein
MQGLTTVMSLSQKMNNGINGAQNGLAGQIASKLGGANGAVDNTAQLNALASSAYQPPGGLTSPVTLNATLAAGAAAAAQPNPNLTTLSANSDATDISQSNELSVASTAMKANIKLATIDESQLLKDEATQVQPGAGAVAGNALKNTTVQAAFSKYDNQATNTLQDAITTVGANSDVGKALTANLTQMNALGSLASTNIQAGDMSAANPLLTQMQGLLADSQNKLIAAAGQSTQLTGDAATEIQAGDAAATATLASTKAGVDNLTDATKQTVTGISNKKLVSKPVALSPTQVAANQTTAVNDTVNSFNSMAAQLADGDPLQQQLTSEAQSLSAALKDGVTPTSSVAADAQQAMARIQNTLNARTSLIAPPQTTIAALTVGQVSPK